MAPPRSRITDSVVRRLQGPGHGNRVTYDDDVTGFGVRVTSAGAKSFVLNYRIAGRERRYTLGRYPAWSVLAAREEARRLRRRIDLGEDPLQARVEERDAATVDDLCAEYSEAHLPRKRPGSQRNDRAMIAQYILPALGPRKVADLEFADIAKLHRSLSKRSPYVANRVIALLSKMFSLSQQWGWRETNPCRGVERNAEGRRERYLSADEIERLNAALTAHPNQQAANVVRMLLLTGARRGELMSSRWEEFDLQGDVWHKPSAHTKQKRYHRVPLSQPAGDLMRSIRAQAVDASPFVFPGRRREAPLKEIKRFWDQIRRDAAIEDVRLHDIRHTYASILVSGGLSLPIVGALLGHTQPGTTARYGHLFDEPLRDATGRVGRAVMSTASAVASKTQKERA